MNDELVTDEGVRWVATGPDQGMRTTITRRDAEGNAVDLPLTPEEKAWLAAIAGRPMESRVMSWSRVLVAAFPAFVFGVVFGALVPW